MRLMTLTGTPIRSKRARPLERTAKKVATLKGTLSSISPQSYASQLLPTVTVEAI